MKLTKTIKGSNLLNQSNGVSSSSRVYWTI